MWSRAFLTVGVVSGVAIATLALVAMWLALFAVSIGDDPSFTPANIVQICAPGVVAYPACWYALIFRKRSYSVGDTVMLVVMTFAALWALVAVILAVGGIYVGATIVATATDPEWGLLLAAASPVAYVFMSLIGAVFLIVPYVAIATPAAFAHRWLMLRLFRAPAAAGASPV